MGHHYVPQAYLRAFQDPGQPGFIWTLPRGDAMPRLLPIKSIAQSPGFYDECTEAELAAVVESPANPLLDKLRRQETITTEERLIVAIYIATMLERVPRNRERAEALLPHALEASIASIRQQLADLEASGGIDSELLALSLERVDAAHAKFQRDPPLEVKAQMRDPRPTTKIVEAVFMMTWRLISTGEPNFFLTSDNPAFFHGAYGIGTPQSELRFPLSPTIALHGTWTPDPQGSLAFHAAPRFWVMEFNRSLASDASALLFYHRKAPWLSTLLHKKNQYLNRLVWT